MNPNKSQLLGLSKLPVEVVQYGAENLFRHFEQKVTILLSVSRMINDSSLTKATSSLTWISR